MDASDLIEDEAAIAQQKLSNEEYKIWKKNSPFLYDLVVTHALEWPSLTCQWFPDKESPAGQSYTQHRLLLGTHTSGQDQNYLQIAQVQLPNTGADGPSNSAESRLDLKQYDEDKGEIGSYSATTARLTVVQKINHDGEINRARYCPQNPDLIATRTVTGKTYVFDRTKHSNTPSADGVCRPDIILEGQEAEGYGLSWSPLKQGHILAASEDTTVCHWDINNYTKGNNTLQPTATYTGHTSIVEDVAWHHHHESLFGSVGDDRQLLLWDTRESPSAPKYRVEAHTGEVNTLAFSPENENILVTGSSDKTVAVWDVRNLKVKLHSLESHTDEILSVCWSPHHPTVLASASADRRVNVWDLSKIGMEQTPEDAEDGPPELIFVHGGHTSRPTDLGWSPHMEWALTSAAEDNIVMVWRPSKAVIDTGNEEVSAEDLE
ncbi:Histone-binding protein RBBP4, N-terminal [Kalmanozyma brasiliensis GHG001]|uniref:Nucleosome remodeling factor, subunit CAF1/NURF55/MSI1 n=1 Tax=Kalmanozyma brasiliensis (strain GHG001) TaxID=1365824 RepID=V5EDU3_KALBG|nr:Histone-binding protein RBBP4, N-terminal [Kalmanozyma brasiliensis GHG001]EST08631.1 Histone-binding protein RBBP4, N-terminal [Kalmanozyma brasiliensis GHG001]